jgi:hypothetical protein
MMLKADRSILQCKVRQLVWNVLRRKAVGLMGVGSGHDLIFELNSDEEFNDTWKLNGCLMVRALKIEGSVYIVL